MGLVNGLSLDQVEKKWYPSENSPQGAWDHVAEEMLLLFAESGHPIFRSTTPLSRGQLKSKGKGKVSIHFSADPDTVDTIYRIILSVNQLSIYGAVAAICDEYESHQDSTEQPVILVGQSIVLGEIKAEVPVHDEEPREDQIILQQYIQQIESLSPENRLSKFCKEAGFMRVVEVGQYFVTRDAGEFQQTVACLEYTLPRDDKASQPKGWIRGNMRIGLVLEVTTSFQHFKYGIEIRIESVNQDDSHSWVRISYGTVKYVIDSVEDNTENLADPQEEQIPQTSTSSSKPTHFPKPIEDRTGELVAQEIVGKSQGKLSSSDRTGEPVKQEEKRVLRNHDRTGKLVEGSSHKVQEVGSLENRDDADKFNLAMDDENIDFNISVVPNAMVKRSQSISVHDLIQKIENHPQREALQNDLQQHRAFNPFSKESKDAIMAAGNTELCEIISVEPKLQCKACLKHWSAGIVYCTCGHLMEDDSAENKKYISSMLDLFSIPNFYIRKGRPHGHRYGKAPGCKEYHTANQLQRKCRKKKYDSIHDRFILDKTFRKAMIELGRSEKIILEMDQLASENHTHVATRAEIDVYRGNWWIRSNVVNFDTMPTRHQLDFKKALSTLYRLKKAEDEKQYAKWSQSSSSWWQWQTNWWESDYENSPQRWGDH